MKIMDLLRNVLRRDGRVAARARVAEEQRAQDAVKAWQRRGGPVDPGFVA